MSAREVILARLAAACSGLAPGEDVESHIHRHSRGPIPLLEHDIVARFQSKASKLSSDIAQVPDMAGAPGVIAQYLGERELPSQAVCWPSLRDLAWSAAGLTVEARSARASDLVGITGAYCGIAETGTLMFLSGPDTPPAVSLLPETHVAVLPVSRIVPAMEDAWALLRKEHGKLPRAVNFVSGPSRTADIEQTVTLGAHGPYRVLIVLEVAG